MNAVIASIRSLTLPKLPRRMAWRVMIPKKISTMFSHDPEVGVKCSVIARVGGPARPDHGRVFVGTSLVKSIFVWGCGVGSGGSGK